MIRPVPSLVRRLKNDEKKWAMSWTRPKAVALAAALWAAIYLPGLGQQEFRGEEGRRVLPAISMLAGQPTLENWLVPQVAGEKYFNKPPGINWIAAGAFAVTHRQDEFTARLPSALFVLAFAVLLIVMDGPFLDVPARLTGALIFLATPIVALKGRTIEIDAVYTATTGMAVLVWLNEFARGNRPWRQWLIPGFLLAAGALVKGPFLGVPYYAMVLCVLGYSRKLRQLVSLPHVLSVLLIAMVGLGWLLLARHFAGSRLVNSTIEGQFEARVMEISLAGWLREVGLSMFYFLPWTLMLPVLWMKGFAERVEPAHRPLLRGCRLGILLGFAGLCLVPGLLARYTMPALPLAAISLGWLLSRPRSLLVTDRFWRGVELAAPVVLLAACVGIAFKYGWTSSRAVLAAALVCGGLVLWRLRAHVAGGLSLSLVTAALVAAVVLVGLALSAGRWPVQVRRGEAEQINRVVPAGQTLYVFRPGYQRFLIFLRPPVRYLLSPEQMGPEVRYLLLTTQPRNDVFLPGVQKLQQELAAYDTTMLCQIVQEGGKNEKKQVFEVLECRPRSAPARREVTSEGDGR
jgi:4-amino-4-deoxy-L-arabinose transferase-like glycosyltransferase